jgi:predicted PurR-regulated permease PerM
MTDTTDTTGNETVIWRRALRQLAWLAGLIIAGWLIIRYLLLPLSPILLGMAWASTARPLANRAPRFVPQVVARLVSVALVMGATLGAAGWIGLRVIRELVAMSMDSLAWQRQLLTSWHALQNQWLAASAEMPESVVFAVDKAIADAMLQVGQMVNMIPGIAFQATRLVPFLLLAIVVASVVAFLLIVGEPVTLRFNRYFPPAWRRRVEALEMAVVAGVGHFLKVQLLIMVVTFSVTLGILTALGVRHSFLLSLTIAVLDLIPVVGPGIVIFPWAVGAWLVGHLHVVYGTTLLYLIILVGRRYAEPRLLARGWGEGGPSPVGMLVALWLGFYFGGIAGAVGTPLALLVSYSLTRPGHPAVPLDD